MDNTFNGGEGNYQEEYMDFPTANSFVIQGMAPGKTILRFHPKSLKHEVQQILYAGEDILDTGTGIDTSRGGEITDVTIVVGTQ